MNFNELSQKVKEIQLGRARITDVAEGTYNVKIEEEQVLLVEGTKRIPVSVASLAAMRIADSAENAKKVENTRDARVADGYKTLQHAIEHENVELTEDSTFTVVHRLQIPDVVNDTVVFKNENYKGYPEYVKASRKAFGMPSTTEEQIAARGAAFTDASDALRASGTKSGVTKTDADALLMMPVFTVASN